MMKELKLAALVTALGGLGLLGSAGHASAGSTLCPSAKVCIYASDDFNLLMGYRSAGGGIVNISAGNNDLMSSWENKIGTNAAWYYGSNGSGGCRNMSAGTENHSLSNFDDNEMSSWKTNGSC